MPVTLDQLLQRGVKGWSIDSRTIQPGDAYFALKGETHDGHDFIDAALQKGASVVVAQRGAGDRVLLVDDPLVTLQHLANESRTRWGGTVIAVTGSAGKTTTKDVIADLVSVALRTSKTPGNFNNHIGMPLSILRMDASSQALVLEMGMNHAGEIRDLAAIAKPDIGVVTNVGYAHIENLGSVEAIAGAKAELVESLGPTGTAILNADDPRVSAMRHKHQGQVVSYGLSPAADVRAENVEFLPEGVSFSVADTKFSSSLTGRHNVLNILAGITAAGVLGVKPEALTEKVAQLQPQPRRGEHFHCGGVLVYNDTYNSNPDAVRAMVDVLRDTPAKRRIAVLGEMLELGPWAEPLHREVGNYVAVSGLDVLVGIRGAACHMLDAAKRAGLQVGAAFFCETSPEAGRLVRTIAQPGDAVLFKGSRGVRVEQAVEAFLEGRQ